MNGRDAFSVFSAGSQGSDATDMSPLHSTDLCSLPTNWQAQLAADGFAVLAAIFSGEQTRTALAQLMAAFAADGDGSTLRGQTGGIYGARNLLHIWPGVIEAWRQAPLPDVVAQVLGPRFGLVRVLFFDKPPGQSWALPWHRDMTIAVRDNRLPSGQFCKPTLKAGVPHVEAPRWLLENMLTVRWHLDDVTEENGPLRVMPGSHRTMEADSQARPPVPILSRAGDVLLMRPLLSHCSFRSQDDTQRHRRILHFEFTGVRELPDGYAWHDVV